MQLRKLPLPRHQRMAGKHPGTLRHTPADKQRATARARMVYLLDKQRRIPTLPPPCPAADVDGSKADQ